MDLSLVAAIIGMCGVSFVFGTRYSRQRQAREIHDAYVRGHDTGLRAGVEQGYNAGSAGVRERAQAISDAAILAVRDELRERWHEQFMTGSALVVAQELGIDPEDEQAMSVINSNIRLIRDMGARHMARNQETPDRD